MNDIGPETIQQAIDHMKQVGLGGLIHTIGQLEDAKAQWRAEREEHETVLGVLSRCSFDESGGIIVLLMTGDDYVVIDGVLEAARAAQCPQGGGR